MKKIISLFVMLAIVSIAGALNPVKEYSVKPDEYGMKYSEVTFETSDGLNLFGWYFNAPKSSGKAIILSHDGDGNMADLIELAGQFVSAGYNVLTYDYRGYGQSDDFEINTSFYIYAQFEKDLSAAIDFVRMKRSGITTVNLYGQGIGAGLSLSVAADNKRVAKVIADSPYTTLLEIQKKYMDVKSEDVKIPLAYDKNILEPLYALENKYAKLKKYLFIVGDEDPIYTVKDIKALSKIVKSTSTVYVVKGATAKTTFAKDKAKYFEYITNFAD
ncbi:MAG: alpha/beta fold hydrolase [Saprospiraceae bacterium]|nr:alpha/beta fold hydrolase [Saprospiraceae bacterium]